MAVVKKRDGEVYLVHMRRFRLGTEYGSVLGYLKLLSSKLSVLHRVLIDQTGLGEVFVEEAVKSGLRNAQGVVLALPKKQELMVYLKQLMEEGRVHIPFDREVINEMNHERYELMKSGQMKYSHPDGTHDDRLWALALAVYASRTEIPRYHLVALTGKVIKPWWQTPRSIAAPRAGPRKELSGVLVAGSPSANALARSEQLRDKWGLTNQRGFVQGFDWRLALAS